MEKTHIKANSHTSISLRNSIIQINTRAIRLEQYLKYEDLYDKTILSKLKLSNMVFKISIFIHILSAKSV